MIRAILVDDEPLALRHMEKKLNDLGTVEIVKSFSNVRAVLKEMKLLNFQVAFLDIEMPGLNGLDLAEIIQEWNKDIQIVFVTAFRDYAIQAFELNSIDYLMKPILTDRLEITMSRIQEQIQLSNNQPSTEQETLPSLNIICFGEFSVYDKDELVKWKTAKVKELFAFFITNPHTYVNRDTLIELLWPGNDHQKAKIQLHTSISHLRRTLEKVGYSKVLIFSNQSYALELSDFQCDALELEQMIKEHASVNRENIQVFEQAVQKYNGDYMEIDGYEWATIKAESIRHKLLQLLQKMIDYYTEYDKFDKKSRYLQILLEHSPYSEHALQQLMQHYIKIGNRGDAVKLYHHFKDLLIEDLGILPDRTTNELLDSILQGHLK